LLLYCRHDPAHTGTHTFPYTTLFRSSLEKYGRDLTAAARQGKLDPVIGRDEEIRRVIHVISRRTKNNPVLIGEAGVGKSAIAERSEEHTSELQSRENLVCRLLLEKKK